MTTMNTRAVVLGPPLTRSGPLPGQLTTAAAVSDGPVYWLDGQGAIESANRLVLRNLYNGCAPSGSNGKAFGPPGWVNAVPFATYGGLVCSTVGFDTSAWSERLGMSMAAMESTALEAALMSTILGGSNCEEIAAPFDMSKGLDQLYQAVGMLEGYVAYHYAGVPVIHLPRSLLTWFSLGNGVYRDGDRLATALGSSLVGGSYGLTKTPAGADPAANTTRYLYVTGDVLIRRGQSSTAEGNLVGSGTSVLDPAHNTVTQLAERLYLIGVDSFIAAVQLTNCPVILLDATGATAGIPGTWTPAGSLAPVSTAQLSGIAPTPTTAWTTGQYMQTATPGTTGQAYWNGTAWTNGKAP